MPGKLGRDLPARPPQSVCRRKIPVAGTRLFPLELDETVVAPIELGQLLAQGLPLRNDVAKRWAILPLEPLEQRQSVLDLLEPCRRGFDGVSVAS